MTMVRPCKNSMSCRQDGAVLIVVIALVAVLSTTALMVMRGAVTDNTASGFVRMTDKGRLLLSSAISLAAAVLIKDTPDVDSLRDKWLQYDLLLKTLADKQDGLIVQGAIVDAQSAFSLNLLGSVGSEDDQNARIFLTLFDKTLRNAPAGSASKALWVLKDWVDSDTTEARLGRVEQEAYARLDSSALPLDRPFLSLGEALAALQVAGILPFVDMNKFVHFFHAGLKTKVNINTAPRDVLESLFPERSAGKNFADAAITYRSQPANDLSGMWAATLSSGLYSATMPQSILTTQSGAYSMLFYCNGVDGTYAREVHLERSGTQVRVAFIEPLEPEIALMRIDNARKIRIKETGSGLMPIDMQ